MAPFARSASGPLARLVNGLFVRLATALFHAANGPFARTASRVCRRSAVVSKQGPEANG
jgi:hypothetical protein